MHNRVGFLAGILVIALSGNAWADVIDLNAFWADAPVSVAPDGTSAVFEESDTLISAILSNDPFLGDLEVIVAAPNRLLEFDYNFFEAPLGNDEFGAWIIDPDTGFSLGAPFEFFLNESGSGTVSFDLSSLADSSGLGFQFQFSSLPGDSNLESTLQISNLRLVTIPVVPEPSTAVLALLAFGMFGIHRRFGAKA